MATPATVKTHAAAFALSLVEAGLIEEAIDFVEWCYDNLDFNISHVLPAEFEEEF